ncbi:MULTISPECIES: glycosyltransferase [unclassified Legionella]|uniref:glycosyltransferase n=1 Tax=unclassified Legionella TaxID=2622702 RepID=UPI001E5C246F|nr:glycosyltransferase [Legionella sp. 31fI33]MCC5015339.1 hypothetical protein [Legionella sp. 31fI33]
MESKREIDEERYIIPNKLHAVWLGKVLDKEDRSNILAWSSKNKDYESNLWIDSSTYAPEAKPELMELLSWAKKNNIKLCDVNPNPPWKIKHANYIRRPDVYERMIYRPYYDDEIAGQYPNFAAASDMLRATILDTDGGVYYDARDMPPGKPLPKLFKAKNDFLFHSYLGTYNNDLLAAAPGSVDLHNYMESIKENYRRLYKGSPPLLEAHRNPNREAVSSGFSARRSSTINVSGPLALVNSLKKAYRDWTDALHLCSFPQAYYTQPPTQDVSWFDPNLLEDERHILIIFGNSIKDHLADNFLKTKIQSLSNQPMFQNSALKKALTQLQQGLLAFDSSQMTLTELYKTCISDIERSKHYQELSPKDKALFEDISGTIGRCMVSASKFIELGKHKQLDAKTVFEMLSRIGPHAKVDMSQRVDLSQFITDVLLTEDGNPNLTALDGYGIKYTPPEQEPNQTTISNI